MGRQRRQSKVARRVVAVGLTGGIGAGKSTALALFAELGANTLSSDEMVHRLYEQPAVVDKIREHFGPLVVSVAGVVDRGRLALAVRGKPEELAWLEELTHPLVAEQIDEQVDGAPEGSVVVCEVPLLFEAGYERLFDLVVTVEADPEVRRERSTHDFDLEQFTEFEALQASRERRTQGSDFAFVNDGDLDGLREFAEKVYMAASACLGPAGCGDVR